MTLLNCACGSAFDLELEVHAAILASFALDRPLVIDGVAQLQGIEGLREADAVAHVEARREIAPDYQLVLVIAACFDVHICEIEAQLLPELRGK